MKDTNISRNCLNENLNFLANNFFRDQIMNFTENIISCTECKKTVRKKDSRREVITQLSFDRPLEVLNFSGQFFEQKQSAEILLVLLRIRLPLAD